MTTSRRIQQDTAIITASTDKYSDFDLAFNPTGDIRPIKDLAAIKASIQHIILTGENERPFQPDLGTGVSKYLFEQPSASSIVGISNDIKTVLKLYEPRIKVTDVRVSFSGDTNSYELDMDFDIIGSARAANLTLSLERVR